jgi:predicted secreted Zn-dependent protease
VLVGAEILETLPQWDSRERAADDVRREWDRFLAAVEQHEDGHVRIGVAAAEKLGAAISALSFPTCEEVDRQADRLGASEIANMKERQHAYDLENEHGAKTGGTLAVR